MQSSSSPRPFTRPSSFPSYLPIDIFRLILDHLTYDKFSLHSCLLVNRHWCRVVVRVLWQQPFRLLYTCKQSPCNCCSNEKQEKRQSQAGNLLETCMKVIICKHEDWLIGKRDDVSSSNNGENLIYQDRKKLILQYNINLLRNRSRNLSQDFSSLVSTPTFDYLEFLQCLDFLELWNAVQDWIKSINRSKHSNNTCISVVLTNHANSCVTSFSNYHAAANAEDHNHSGSKASRLPTSINFDHRDTSTTVNSSKRRVDYMAILQTFYNHSDNLKDTSKTIATLNSMNLMNSANSTRLSKSGSLSIEQIANLLSIFFSMHSPLHHLSSDLTSRHSSANSGFPCSILSSRLSTFANLYTPTLSDNLIHLTSLVCTTKLSKHSLFTYLSRFAHNIRHLEVCIDYLDHHHFNERILDISYVEEESLALSALIKSQKSIVSLKLFSFPAGLQSITSAIHQHANSLRSLSFIGVYFDGWELLPILEPLRNLETLECRGCFFQLVFGFTPESHPPVHLEFTHLKKLDMMDSYVEPPIMRYLLKSCSAKVTYLDLGRKIQDPKSPEDSNILMRLVETQFPKLKHLMTSFHEHEIKQLLEVFECCTELESCVLCPLDSYNSAGMNELMRRMGECKLKKLRYFGIRGTSYVYSVENFNAFLKSLLNTRENDDKNFRILEIDSSTCFSNEHLETVLKHLGGEKENCLQTLKLKLYRELDKQLIVKAGERIRKFEYEMWDAKEQAWENMVRREQ
ncbi:899_t:CDS:1 [Acaulospora morrowiae]|uniref:899_t:CDS:1 n=1 Tax=Acaulospora morrowiae TaxID=94023 RepID=A0A9N9GWZ5_9GLOM|nr:899_t:CDS:1 [Acaulospora morrowiae]